MSALDEVFDVFFWNTLSASYGLWCFFLKHTFCKLWSTKKAMESYWPRSKGFISVTGSYVCIGRAANKGIPLGKEGFLFSFKMLQDRWKGIKIFFYKGVSFMYGPILGWTRKNFLRNYEELSLSAISLFIILKNCYSNFSKFFFKSILKLCFIRTKNFRFTHL